jgi:hypothetical protein
MSVRARRAPAPAAPRRPASRLRAGLRPFLGGTVGSACHIAPWRGCRPRASHSSCRSVSSAIRRSGCGRCPGRRGSGLSWGRSKGSRRGSASSRCTGSSVGGRRPSSSFSAARIRRSSRKHVPDPSSQRSSSRDTPEPHAPRVPREAPCKRNRREGESLRGGPSNESRPSAVGGGTRCSLGGESQARSSACSTSRRSSSVPGWSGCRPGRPATSCRPSTSAAGTAGSSERRRPAPSRHA